MQQLDVVDQDQGQGQGLLGVEPGALGAQLLDGEGGRVVEVEQVAVGAQALGLLLDVQDLLEAAG